MSKASQMRGKGELVKFETEDGEVEWRIKPLKNKELLEITDMAERKQTSDMLTKMIFYTLRKDDITVTEQEIKEMDSSFLMDLINIIAKVNKLEAMFDFRKSGQSTSPQSSQSVQENSLVAQLNANPRRPVNL